MTDDPFIPQPSAATLASFEMPIPTRLANKRILTRNQLGRAIDVSRQLTIKRRYIPHANPAQPPSIAAKLHAAYISHGAGRQRTSLSAVLGDGATPIEIALIIEGGNHYAEFYDILRDCMLRLLRADAASHDASIKRLFHACIYTVTLGSQWDPEMAHAIFNDSTLRKRYGASWVSKGLHPVDLQQYFVTHDFRSAVEALYNESARTCEKLIRNPTLTSRQLEDVVTVLTAPLQKRHYTDILEYEALSHPACRPDLFQKISVKTWRKIADYEPDLVFDLWSKFHEHSHAWICVFAALIHGDPSTLQRLPMFVERVRQWAPPSRQLAATLLATSGNAETAALGASGFSTEDS